MSDKTTTKKSAGNRRKSRELALKGLYQHLLSPKELRLIVREMADEPDFTHADEGYFRSLRKIGLTMYWSVVYTEILKQVQDNYF